MRAKALTIAPKQAGFTLIEIMVVIVIIGIFAVAVVPNVIDRPEQARATKVAQDIAAIESALKLYRLDNFSYPSQGQALGALVNSPGDSKNWRGPYMDAAPKDPWGNEYMYLNPGTHGRKVEVFTYGRDKAEGGEGEDADRGSWNINE